MTVIELLQSHRAYDLASQIASASSWESVWGSLTPQQKVELAVIANSGFDYQQRIMCVVIASARLAVEFQPGCYHQLSAILDACDDWQRGDLTRNQILRTRMRDDLGDREYALKAVSAALKWVQSTTGMTYDGNCDEFRGVAREAVYYTWEASGRSPDCMAKLHEIVDGVLFPKDVQFGLQVKAAVGPIGAEGRRTTMAFLPPWIVSR